MYLDNYIGEIKRLCEKHKVRYLHVFGSVLTSDFSDNSDVDFIIDLKPTDPIEYAENYFEFKFHLEELLNRPIDLLEHRGLKNRYLIESLNRTKQVLYEA
jgi:predicted nucleotidyltransferase